jgi:hypothetical protein
MLWIESVEEVTITTSTTSITRDAILLPVDWIYERTHSRLTHSDSLGASSNAYILTAKEEQQPHTDHQM